MSQVEKDPAGLYLMCICFVCVECYYSTHIRLLIASASEASSSDKNPVADEDIMEQIFASSFGILSYAFGAVEIVQRAVYPWIAKKLLHHLKLGGEAAKHYKPLLAGKVVLNQVIELSSIMIANFLPWILFQTQRYAIRGVEVGLGIVILRILFGFAIEVFVDSMAIMIEVRMGLEHVVRAMRILGCVTTSQTSRRIWFMITLAMLASVLIALRARQVSRVGEFCEEQAVTEEGLGVGGGTNPFSLFPAEECVGGDWWFWDTEAETAKKLVPSFSVDDHGHAPRR